MSIVFLLLVIVALITILGIVFFFASILAISIRGFVKRDRSLGYFFLGIFLLSALIFAYTIMNGNKY